MLHSQSDLFQRGWTFSPWSAENSVQFPLYFSGTEGREMRFHSPPLGKEQKQTLDSRKNSSSVRTLEAVARQGSLAISPYLTHSGRPQNQSLHPGRAMGRLWGRRVGDGGGW